MLNRESAQEPVDVTLVGDPTAVKSEIKRLADIGGVTDLCAFVFHAEPGAFEKTIDRLSALC
jgi:alkanesulfonate monooxygenase SsuD/methylene tetrahydromethanopterin reductase-like flavin-dependent oxidoreductase (luciferase family)